MVKIFGEKPLANIPWQERPEGCTEALWRWTGNPVIDRNPIASSPRIYNSAIVPWQGEFVGVFRADGRDGLPRLHFGSSSDGLAWRIEPEPIQFVDEAGEAANPLYAYDPRVARIDGTYYVTWCTDKHGPTIGVATTEDFKSFVRLEDAYLPFNRNGVLFPRRFGNNFLMLNRPSDNGHTPFGDIFLSQSPDMCYWGRHRHVMAADGGGGWWDDTKIGAGPIPIETEDGWLMLYHGVGNSCNGYVYSMGGVILDRDDPSKVLHRGKEHLLSPETDYESVGFVPNVFFPCAALCDSETGRLAVYYGAADTVTAVAFGYLDEIMQRIREH